MLPKSLPILVTETHTRSLSYTFCGSGTWVQLNWVLPFRSLPVCSEGGGRGWGSRLKVSLKKSLLLSHMVVGRIQFLSGGC